MIQTFVVQAKPETLSKWRLAVLGWIGRRLHRSWLRAKKRSVRAEGRYDRWIAVWNRAVEAERRASLARKVAA